MVFFRTVITWAAGVPFTLGCFIAVLAAFLVDRTGDLVHSIASFWARGIVCLAGVRVEVSGVARFPAAPFIIASNHRGAFDIPVLHGHLPIQFRWVAKKSLFRVPVIGWSMTLAGYIPIEREHAGKAYRSIEAAAGKIRAGTSVLIFPEGTRSGAEVMLPFKRGGFMLASRSGAPVVPVGVSGTEDIYKDGILIRPARVKVVVGEPIASAGVDESDLKRKTREAIEGLL